MGTIIKVKRKINEDPVDCLILQCKKKRLITNDSGQPEPSLDSINQIFKYAGSAKNEDEIPAKIMNFSTKLQQEKTNGNGAKPAKRRTKTINKKELNKESEKKNESNYVLISKKRGLSSLESNGDVHESNDTDINNELNEKKIKISNLDNINVIDVVKSDESKNLEKPKQTTNGKSPLKESGNTNEKITCNGVELIRETVNSNTTTNGVGDYVYDIYYTNNSEIHLDLLYANNYQIKSFSGFTDLELIDDTYDDEPENVYEDDEDSNDEGNWRNDYPDEEDDYDDNDIDDEDDDDARYYGRSNKNYYDDEDEYDDNYNEYGYGDDDDDKRLSHYMKKSCVLDRSYYDDEKNSENEDDYDEYDGDEVPKSFSSYKKKLLKDLEHENSNF